MKKNITVFVEEELVEKAKRIARERGISLSDLVEEFFREFITEGRHRPLSDDDSPLTR